MTLKTLLKRTSLTFTSTCQRLVVLASIVPGVVFAQGLPAVDPPTQGGGGGLLQTLQGYAYDGFILGGLLVAAVAFIWVALGAISSFNEARVRGEWAKFGVTTGVGILLILVVIWLATEAAPILSQ